MIDDCLERVQLWEGGEPDSPADRYQRAARADLRVLLRQRRVRYVLSGAWLLDAVFPNRAML